MRVGENGVLVSFLESFEIYSSSGNFSALNICMNKFIFKQVMRGLKVPVVSGFKISKIDYETKFDVNEKIKLLKFLYNPLFPCFASNDAPNSN